MRRLWLIVVAVLALAQWSYAAAGAYCLHEGERSSASAHWGHHYHAHTGHEQAKTPDTKASFDGDCAFCHAGTAFSPAPLVTVDAGPPAAPRSAAVLLHPASRSPDTPERPQWRTPALA